MSTPKHGMWKQNESPSDLDLVFEFGLLVLSTLTRVLSLLRKQYWMLCSDQWQGILKQINAMMV